MSTRAIPGEIAGKFYWPVEHYSIPADNLCWHIPPAPNRDFRCVRSFGHVGKCQHEWSPLIRDYSHKDIGRPALAEQEQS